MSDSSSDPSCPRPRRDSVILNARIEAIDRVVECRVRNLSETGACIDDPAGLPPDGRVLVTIGALHHIEGQVRWTHAGRAGLHFTSGRIDIAAARRPRGAVTPVPQNRAGWLDNLYSPYRRGED